MIAVCRVQTGEMTWIDCINEGTHRILDRGRRTGRLTLARLKIVQLDMDWMRLDTDGLQMVIEMADYLFVKKRLYIFSDEGK